MLLPCLALIQEEKINMMINKRLIALMKNSKQYICLCVFFQWLGLAANTVAIFSLASLLASLQTQLYSDEHANNIPMLLWTSGIAILLRFVCGVFSAKTSYKSSAEIKGTLREKIYTKLLKLGIGYTKHISTAEAVQLSGEGVEQLEIYFGRYLPQFFYSLLASATLLVILSFISLKVALLLLVCVPIIPLSIIIVQKFAKKIFQKYWGEYTALGDDFLENVQGLTTLKIYQADERKNLEMNKQAEHFRKITMKVLTMQLNSITIMDLVAYSGAALGTIIALLELAAGRIDISSCAMIILMSAEFFIPLRLLGSYFHIAMNGLSASEKMFRLLDIPEGLEKSEIVEKTDITIKDLSFSYDESREILHSVSMDFSPTGFTAIVGASGCGKSTIASLLTGANDRYSGKLLIGGKELSSIREDNLLKHVTLIGHQSYLFSGTVRENLQVGKRFASDEQMTAALKQVKLWEFLHTENGLDTRLTEAAANLSGGQRQRLALARILLRDSDVIIFDEATSNIDVECETDIMEIVKTLAKTKTIIVISHRLANIVNADNIYVMNDGAVAESGKHEELLQQNGHYSRLWNEQQELEQIREVAV